MKKHLLFIVFTFIFSMAIPLNAKADSTTNNNIYAIADLTERAIDVVLRKAKGIKTVTPIKLSETDLTSQHSYQAYIACLDEIRKLQGIIDMPVMPKIIATPQKYTPSDVKQVANILLMEVQKIAIQLNIWGLPKIKYTYKDKTSSDIFKKMTTLQYKLHLLAGKKEYTPLDIYNELAGSLSDTLAILDKIDPSKRYKIIFPKMNKAPTNKDVYQQALTLRAELTTLRKYWHLPNVKHGTASVSPTLTDILAQSHIIRAELNTFKITNKIKTSTVETLAQRKMELKEVYHQLQFISFLSKQIPEIRMMVKN